MSSIGLLLYLLYLGFLLLCPVVIPSVFLDVVVRAFKRSKGTGAAIGAGIGIVISVHWLALAFSGGQGLSQFIIGLVLAIATSMTITGLAVRSIQPRERYGSTWSGAHDR